MQSRPPALLVLAITAVVEGIAFLVNAASTGWSAWQSGLTGPAEVSSAQGFVLELVIFIVFGLALVATGRGWLHARRWARSVHVLAQLLILVVAIPSLGAVAPAQQVIAWIAAVLAGGTLVLALAPTVTRAIVPPDERG